MSSSNKVTYNGGNIVDNFLSECSKAINCSMSVMGELILFGKGKLRKWKYWSALSHSPTAK